MKTEQQLKDLVRDKYSEIALQDKDSNQSSCCGAGSCSTGVYNIMTDDYTDLKGYNKDADLGLGCGLPTQFAKIELGDTVIDLGSGAGNDAFIARHETGDAGYVIGIDFTPAMIDKAKKNEPIFTHKYLNGFPKLDLLSIDDFLAAAEHTIKFKGTETFNIGSGQTISTKKIAEIIVETFKSKSTIASNEINSYYPNIKIDYSKLRSAVNWEPKNSFIKFIEKLKP
jgi:SAM-dependent methyltransferase